MRKFILQADESRKRVIAYLNMVLDELPTEKPFEVVVKKHVKSKTDEQRKGWHFLLKIFGDETGYTLHEVKELIKLEILETKIVIINGIEKEIAQSSESLKRDDYSNLIEATYRLAAEAGIILPVLQK